MADVHLKYINESFIKVVTDAGILMELADSLTYKADNYQFSPQYKARVWDGNISLLNRLTGVTRSGLAFRIKKFCDSRDYTISFDDELKYDNVARQDVLNHIKSLNLPDWLDVRDYQVDAILKCLQSRRRTLLSPTSSGKSLMIHLLHTWYNLKSLIIVPTTGLVQQFESDLRSYGFTGKIHTSVGGLSKDTEIDAEVVITTWQSVCRGKSKLPNDARAWLQQFHVVFGDEAHSAKAALLTSIIENMSNTPYRFGTTGTLGKSPLMQATVEGLFGPVYQSTTTRELIDDGYAADIKIKCLILKYPESVRKEFNRGILVDKVNKKYRKRTYAEEVDFINEYKKRTSFVRNLALSLKGNTLIFFRKKDHGKSIYESFDNKDKVFYIDGDVKDREAIRQAMEVSEDAILIASSGTTSTGVSIKRLHHMISAAMLKSEIKLLQSIGRMLRQHESKEQAYMYDIVDDLSWKSSKNYAMKHFEERAKIYDEQNFDYKMYFLDLE